MRSSDIDAIPMLTSGQNNKFQFQRPSAAAKAANVLGCSADQLNRAIFQATSKPDARLVLL